MKKILLYIAVFHCLASCNGQANETPLFSAPAIHTSFWDSLPNAVGWVSDFEHLFTPEQIRLLDSVIESFDKENLAQLAIVTLDTNSTAKDSFDLLVTHIGQQWGVGEKGKDNGVVIGISTGYKKIKISNGYGIERVITNKETKAIIEKYFVPHFKQAGYFTGMYEGVLAMIKLLRKRLK